MARNSEKAMTALARWRNAQLEHSKEPARRPYLATECTNLYKSEKWRRQIIGEISRKVSQIQNAGLGEYKLRDLNDEINKLLREKGHWEDQILILDGPNYRKTGPKMLDHDGKEVPGNRGYKYFGAAKDLPGVRELFDTAPPMNTRKTCVELMRNIDADYYGYRDEDDNILIPLEKVEEIKAIKAKIVEYRTNIANARDPNRKIVAGEDDDNLYKIEDKYDIDDESFQRKKTQTLDDTEEDTDLSINKTKDASGLPIQNISHVPVPSQKDIEQALLIRKKEELLKRYASDSLQDDTTTTKNLLA